VVTWRHSGVRRLRGSPTRFRPGGCSKRPVAATARLCFVALTATRRRRPPRPSRLSSNALLQASRYSTCSATGTFAGSTSSSTPGAGPASGDRAGRDVALRELDRVREARTTEEATGPVFGLSAVDLGTGSGVIALSLVAERADVRVVATDRDSAALEVAPAICRRSPASGRARVQLGRGRLVQALPARVAGHLDLVVSNPPYLAEHEWSGLSAPSETSTRWALWWRDRAGWRQSRQSFPARLGGSPPSVRWLSRSRPIKRELRSSWRTKRALSLHQSNKTWRATAGAGGAYVKPTELDELTEALSDGKVVAVPTDTVYGLAADPRLAGAVDRVFRLKQRPESLFDGFLELVALDGLVRRCVPQATSPLSSSSLRKSLALRP